MTVIAFALTVAIAQTSAIAGPQQRPVYRLGILPIVFGPGDLVLKGLRAGLKDRGYIEGNNILLDVTIGGAMTASAIRHKALAYQDQHVDIIVTIGSTTAVIVQKQVHGVPIVFIPARTPVLVGLVKSLARPETNATGVASVQAGMFGKAFELFTEVAPTMRKVTVLYYAREKYRSSIPRILSEVRMAAAPLEIELAQKAVKSGAEALRAISLLSKDTTDGIFCTCSYEFLRVKELTTTAMAKNLPFFGCPAHVREQGGLASYFPDMFHVGYTGASYVDRILKGAKPGHLPVEFPTKYEFAINLKTAEEIGLKIPPEVIMRADKIFR